MCKRPKSLYSLSIIQLQLTTCTYNLHHTLLPPGGGQESLTCVSIQDLAAVGQELKHLELTAVGGHHDVAVVLPKELHIQNFIIVAHELGIVDKITDGNISVSTSEM